MTEMTGAQALVAQLMSEGVDTIFGLPGVQIMPVLDALHEKQNALRLVHTRHEQATTYMADGYAKVTGRTGVAGRSGRAREALATLSPSMTGS